MHVCQSNTRAKEHRILPASSQITNSEVIEISKSGLPKSRHCCKCSVYKSKPLFFVAANKRLANDNAD